MANEAKVAAKDIDIILLFRLLKKSEGEAVWKLAFQTEHENTRTKDSGSVATKDGSVRILGSLEIDFSATSILSVGDPYVDQLEEALDNDDITKIWEINKAKKGIGDNVGKYKATYYQGHVTSFGKSLNTKDTVEVSLEFGINGKGAKGFAILTVDQEEVVQYVFKDTTIEKDDPERVDSPSVGSITPTLDGASTELSQERKTIMVDIFKIYKG